MGLGRFPVFSNSVKSVLKLTQDHKDGELKDVKAALSRDYQLLGEGDYKRSAVFAIDTKRVIKVYKKTDKGYNNYVRSCLFAGSQFSDASWFKHMPTMYLFEAYDGFNMVVMERLIEYRTIEKKYPHDIQRFISMVTPKPYGSLKGALHEAWGRLRYKGLIQEFSCPLDYEHYQVTQSLDDVMSMVIQSCHSVDTCCDLGPENMMFRRMSKHQYEIVMSDPFCEE